MMSIQEFMAYLQDLDIFVFVEADKLRVNAPEGILTPALTEKLKVRKQDILDYLQAKSATEKPNRQIKIIDRQGKLTLSSAQKRFWFLDQFEPNSHVYNLPNAYRIDGNLKVQVLEDSFNRIIARQEVFRLYCESFDGKPILKVLPNYQFKLPIIDLTNLSSSLQELNISQYIEEDRVKPFDLDKAPLFRAKLLKLSHNSWILIINLHHFIADGWSMKILGQEISCFYQSLIENKSPQLPSLTIQYLDYAFWQEERLAGTLWAKQLDYWQNKLKDSSFVLDLPLDKPRPKIQTYNGSTQQFVIKGDLLTSIRNLSRQEGVTLFMMLLSVFKILLYQYSQQSDIIVGTTVSNRPQKVLENLIGTFANNLPLRSYLDDEITFQQLLSQVKKTVIESFNNQDLPFEKLVDELNITRDLSRNLVYQVAFIVHQQNKKSLFNFAEIHCQAIPSQQNTAQNDLSLIIRDRVDELVASFEYNTALFNGDTITKLEKQFKSLLQEVTLDVNQKVSQLPLFERKTITKQLSFLLIGWDSLVINCAKLLIEKGNKVVGVISEGDLVSNWAKKENIPHVSSVKHFEDLSLNQSFDYLFSIYNTEIIPQSILDLPKKYAINCHDGLLPKYAGLNAPSWAIINQEIKHGITWHLMTETIDEGDILKQIELEVVNDETTFSLSTKCFEAAMTSFPDLINDLLLEKISPQPQKLIDRTIFYGYQKPTPSCLILWEDSAEKIETLFRASIFKNIPNYLGLLKVHIGECFYIVNQLKISPQKSVMPAGTIVVITNSVEIATITNNIIIQDLTSIEGQNVSVSQLCEKHELKEGDFLPQINEKTKHKLLSLDKKLFKHEKFWVKKLANLYPLEIPLPQTDKSNNRSNYQEKVFNTPQTVIEFIDNRNKLQKNALLVVIFTGYLSRISQNYNFDIGIKKNDLTENCQYLESLFAVKLPLRVSFGEKGDLYSCLEAIIKELKLLEKHQTFYKDIFLRYPEIKKLNNQPYSQTFDIVIELTEDFEVNKQKHNNLLTVLISAQKNQYKLIYDANKLEDKTVEQFLDDLTIFAENFVANENLFLSKIPLVSEAKINQIIKKHQETKKDYLEEKFVHELFERQVIKTPNKIAVAWEKEQLTYQQLNIKTNQLAYYLQKQNVKTETLVAIYLERSLTTIIAILAVLKAGGAYIPIDSKSPVEKIKWMQENAQITIFLTQKSLSKSLQEIDANVIYLDQDWEAILQEKTHNPVQNLALSNLAYLIYTSGSTGKPKGVMIEHKSLSYFAQTVVQEYGIYQDDSILQFANIGFDTAIEEIFPCLLTGATLVLRTEEMLNSVQTFMEKCNQWQLTVLDLPTAYWNVLVTELSQQKLELPESLRLVIIGGEKMIPQKVTLWQKMFKNKVELINGYGPTEATVVSTVYKIKPNHSLNIIPIGHHLPYVQTYILDQNLQLLPTNIKGELYIGGEGLARGYINNLELTKKSFIDNPFGEGKLYKTGDKARYLPDGNIEFLGRIDNQVKIRGFRIELGEIEANLNQHPDIQESIVFVKENEENDKYLVAYLICKRAISTLQLRQYLAEKVPEYMIPSAFVLLDQFPLTPNGKIDKKALPHPDWENNREEKYIAPTHEVEVKVAKVWQEILGIKKIGIHDNFFNLGGHSLLATQVISRLNNVFQVELSLRYLFEFPTISELAIKISQSTKNENVTSIPVISREKNLPLSFAQERLWFINQLEGNTTLYNMPMVIKIEGNLNIDALENAIAFLFKRHESLNTNFINQEGKPCVRIKQGVELVLEKLNVENLSTKEIKEIVNDKRRQILDLEKDQLAQFSLLRISETENILVILIHHIISDGWSMGILTAELSQLYQAYSENKTPSLPELSIQYLDFAAWQRKHLQAEKLDKQLNYWQKQLEGIPPLLELPTDFSRPIVQTYQGKSTKIDLPVELIKKLKQLSKQQQATLFMTMLTAFSILLSKYSNQEDIVIGTPIANRNDAEIEKIIGFFANTLALRINLENNPKFNQLLAQVKRKVLEAHEYEDLPFEKLVEKLNPERSLNHHPIFQVMLVWNNISEEKQQWGNLKVKSGEFNNQEFSSVKFDLCLTFIETKQEIKAVLSYNIDLFAEETINRIKSNFKVLLSEIVNNPNQEISQLELLTKTEKKQILKDWNNTENYYPKDKCIHKLFEEQVIKTPDKIAVVFEEEKLTYLQLNQKSNQLANYLRKLGVKTETVVGICIDRSLEMMIAMLGILKAGGAYLPIDSNSPKGRLNFILEDTKTSLVLTNKTISNLNNLSSKLTIINLQKDWSIIAQETTEKILDSQSQSNNLAHIIYTSGSTGKPKGVMTEHVQIVNYICSAISLLKLDLCESFLLLQPLFFDACLTTIWGSLIQGKTLHILSEENTINYQIVSDYLNQHSIDYLKITPFHLKGLAEFGKIEKLIPKKCLLLGGESSSWHWLKLIYSKRKNCSIFNHYGPTETTVGVSMIPIIQQLIESRNYHTTPIGKPIGNTQTYILNKNLQPLPIGVVGELHIAGDGLARGYLNRPQLTAEKFIQNPFGEGRLYKTGDKARYLSDGNIEFLGRIDNQVKIRGFRIELGEIEANLNQHPCIQEAIVFPKKNEQNDQYLVAYLIGKKPVSTSQLRQDLAEKIPEYMIPSAFVFLERFPLTPNGKIDKKALPNPDWENNREEEYIAPTQEIEIKIAKVWQEILGIEKIGIHDNFFTLGGHSLLATQVISRLNNAFQVELSLRYLFECPTVSELAVKISQSTKNENATSIPVISREKNLLLSFAQERLWFINQLEGNNPLYNMPMVIKIEGNLNIDALENAIAFLFKRHESLNTNFINQEGKPCVRINQEVELVLEKLNVENLSTKEIEEIINRKKQTKLDLEKDQLAQFSLLQISKTKHILVILIHHIISDGWSMGILTEELSQLYQAFTNRKLSNLPQLPIQYVDFASWQRKLLNEETLKNQLNYWKKELKNSPPTSTFPTDYPRQKTQEFKGRQYQQLIKKSLLNQLIKLGNRQQVTLFITLLTALKILLYRNTQQEKLIIGFPVSGRNNLQVEKLIGLFINTLLVSSEINRKSEFIEILNQVKEAVFKANENQDIPFEKIVEEIQVERNLSHNPIFQIWFNMVNLQSQKLKLNGLETEYLLTNQNELSSKFDLTIYAQETEEGLKLIWVYNKNLYQETTIKFLAQQYENLLEAIVINPYEKINKIKLLKISEKQSLTNRNKLNKLSQNWQLNLEKSLTKIFEKQVEIEPEKIAVKSKNKTCTYEQLNEKANQIAREIMSLSELKIKQIGLLFRHEIDMIVAILAVLKTGKVYVPLDASHPKERINYILKDSQTNLLLTNTNNYDLASKLTEEKIQIINIDKITTNSENNLNLPLKAENIAYILYTSGSTGKPKGVVQTNGHVCYFINQYSKNLQINKQDQISLLTSINFDAAVMDIWAALLNGVTLNLYDVKLLGLEKLPQWLHNEEITIYHSTPTLYRYLMKEISAANRYLLSQIRLVILGGEEVVKKDVETYQENFAEDCQFINGYGPTESTVTLQYLIDKKTPITRKTIPIGYPIEGTEILLLDEDGNDTEILGEIGIKSEYVAQGYWQKPELTQKVFLLDSEKNSSKRIYRTGDWGRLLSDRTIEFWGRKDFQVKIRGFRVELSEIESKLNQHPHLKETVIIAVENEEGEKELIAYVIANSPQLVDSMELRRYLQKSLPEYMIPSAYVKLEAFPLTPSGKIARNALAKAERETQLHQERILATTETEKKLVKIWKSVLKIEQEISVNDNFFALGGHSLIATQVISRIRNNFHINLPLSNLFDSPTITELGDRIDNILRFKSKPQFDQINDREEGEI